MYESILHVYNQSYIKNIKKLFCLNHILWIAEQYG